MSNDEMGLGYPNKYIKIKKEKAFFHDSFQTLEQQCRDEEITKLLKQYVSAYKDKIENREKYRRKLFTFCEYTIGGFIFAIILLISCLGIAGDITSIPGTVSLISAFAGATVSILGLIKIITKYYFPENDEECITKIVESIQHNDLLNKVASIKSTEENKNNLEELR